MNSANRASDSEITLDMLTPGKSGVILSVGGHDELRLRLLDMGVIPRTPVTVVKIAPMGDPIQIRVRDYELTLRLDSAKLVKVRKTEEKAKAVKKEGK